MPDSNGVLPSKIVGAVISLVGAIIGALLGGFALFQQMSKPIELRLELLERRTSVVDKILADKTDRTFLTEVIAAGQRRMAAIEALVANKVDERTRLDMIQDLRDLHQGLREVLQDHEQRLRALEQPKGPR